MKLCMRQRGSNGRKDRNKGLARSKVQEKGGKNVSLESNSPKEIKGIKEKASTLKRKKNTHEEG